jgi:hypothetical protein
MESGIQKYFYNMNIDLIFCELEIITTRRKTKIAHCGSKRSGAGNSKHQLV